MINCLYKMDLNCLNDIITDNLAIHIDLSDNNSWDLNTGLTAFSLTKWSNAISNNIELFDWGLTAFDYGRTNEMWSSINIKPTDNLFSMYRIGYNVVKNPTTGETSGVTVNTEYLPISGITDVNYGNYFELDGGYLQGFFKLDGYEYELFPARYNNGITIETLIYLYPDSNGIFYLMGSKSEDKYNPMFSGESGVFTSKDNYLDAVEEVKETKSAFSDYEDRMKTTNVIPSQSANTKNNIIAFEITDDKKIGYKYIDENNNIISNKSIRSINPITGWTLITILYRPDAPVKDIDCAERRKGDFVIFVNGRAIWTIKEFPEFFFHALDNDSEKQISVPYSISWGGGSFGLKNSWHYDLQTYSLYTGQDQSYIDMNYVVESRPYSVECDPTSGGTILNGLSLSADSTTFSINDNCDPNIKHPITVLRTEYTGVTSGITANTYFIKYSNPISVLSNREYEINFNLNVDGFFKAYDDNYNWNYNKISILLYGTEDIDIIDETEYVYPLTDSYLIELPNVNQENIFDDEYSYVKNGISYYGETGLPVYSDPDYYTYYGVNPITNEPMNGTVITGQDNWLPMKTKFKVKDNTGKQIVYIGILIETSDSFNLNRPIYIDNFTYTGSDIIVKDGNKDNLLIQQNFDSSFNGKIQKLRIYDKAFTSQEVLHNALIEMKKNPYLNLQISKGGRIIYR